MNDPGRMHEVLSVLAPPRRFELVVLLLDGVDRSVSRLAQEVGLSQSCTTRHLQALERAGLVRGTRDGKRVVFRVLPSDTVARAVLTALQGGTGSVPAVPSREAQGRSRRPERTPRGARPVAPPVAPPPVVRPSVDPPTAPVESPSESPVSSESGISSAAAVRRRSEIEDFLL